MMILFAIGLGLKFFSEYNCICIIIGVSFFIASVFFAVNMYLDIEGILAENKGDPECE